MARRTTSLPSPGPHLVPVPLSTSLPPTLTLSTLASLSHSWWRTLRFSPGDWRLASGARSGTGGLHGEWRAGSIPSSGVGHGGAGEVAWYGPLPPPERHMVERLHGDPEHEPRRSGVPAWKRPRSVLKRADRAAGHEGVGFGLAAGAASAAPLPWLAGPVTAAPMLCGGEPLGLGRMVAAALSPEEDHCCWDGRFQGPLAGFRGSSGGGWFLARGGSCCCPKAVDVATAYTSPPLNPPFVLSSDHRLQVSGD